MGPCPAVRTSKGPQNPSQASWANTTLSDFQRNRHSFLTQGPLSSHRLPQMSSQKPKDKSGTIWSPGR